MARGQRKSIEEKIAAKQEMIEALQTRVEAEKRELEELYQEKRRKELESVSDIMEESGLGAEEVAEVLQEYLERREAAFERMRCNGIKRNIEPYMENPGAG